MWEEKLHSNFGASQGGPLNSRAHCWPGSDRSCFSVHTYLKQSRFIFVLFIFLCLTANDENIKRYLFVCLFEQFLFNYLFFFLFFPNTAFNNSSRISEEEDRQDFQPSRKRSQFLLRVAFCISAEWAFQVCLRVELKRLTGCRASQLHIWRTQHDSIPIQSYSKWQYVAIIDTG